MSKDTTSVEEDKIVTVIIDIPYVKELLDMGMWGVKLKPIHPLSNKFCIVIQNKKELDELLKRLSRWVNKYTIKEIVEKYDAFINGVKDNEINYGITVCSTMPTYGNSYAYKLSVFKGELNTYNMSNLMGYVEEPINLEKDTNDSENENTSHVRGMSPAVNIHLGKM